MQPARHHLPADDETQVGAGEMNLGSTLFFLTFYFVLGYSGLTMS